MSECNRVFSYFVHVTLYSTDLNNSLIPRRQKTLFITSQTRGEYHNIHPCESSNDPMVCNPVIQRLLPLCFSQKHSLTNLKTTKAVKLDAEVQ